MTLIAPRSERTAGGLSVWIDQGDNRCLILLRGRLCSDTVGVLESHVDLGVCQWCDEVAVDLSRLDRLDGVGAQVLAGLGHYVTARGGSFTVQGAVGAVERLLADAEIHLAG
jgi:anti-anti-sigma regulatory factor